MIIWSTSTHVKEISKGKYPNVTIFDYKADVEDYIRTLPIKSIFYAPGSFMSNFFGSNMPRPSQSGDGTFAITMPFPETASWPLIDVETDTGKFVGAMLAEPEKFYGKVVTAGEGMYSYKEVIEIISKATGKQVVFNQVPPEVFKNFLPPHFNTELLEMLLHCSEIGYYGPKTRELVEADRKLARGKLVTFEEYLQKNPMKLESGSAGGDHRKT